MSQVGYRLVDSQGTVVREEPLAGDVPATTREYPVTGEYMRILSEMTQQEYDLLTQPELEEGGTSVDGEHVVYNALPEEGIDVYQLELNYSDGYGEGINSPNGLGYLSYSGIGEGSVIFNANDASLMGDLELERVATRICFLSAGGEIIYEANNPNGVLEEWSLNHGSFYLITLPIVSAPQIAETTEPFTLYNAIPEEGVFIGQIDYHSEERGACSTGGDNRVLGFLSCDESGSVVLDDRPNSLSFLVTELNHLTYVAFFDTEGTLVYEASGGVLYPDGQDRVIYQPIRLTETEIVGVSVYDAIPPEGMAVVKVSVTYSDDFSESTGGMPEVGMLAYDDSGAVVFTAHSAESMTFREEPVTRITFWDQHDNVVYMASDPDGVGYFYLSSGGTLMFRSETAADAAIAPYSIDNTEPPMTEVPAGLTEAETTMPAVTEVPAETMAPDVTEATMEPSATEITPATEAEPTPESSGMATEPVTAAEEEMPLTAMPTEEVLAAEPALAHIPGAEEASSYWHYYDYTTGTDMVAQYTYETMPKYTLELDLGLNALVNEYKWLLMDMVYGLRHELPKILGFSLLLFAVCAVYLCCAAGKKPGTTEIRAGGLNCISLDAYLAVGFLGVLVCFWLGVEGTEYLLPNSTQTGLVFAGLMAYGACLIVVGFCFACAAQFKTPGGYWWHNSLCGRLVKLLGVSCGWLLRVTEWMAVKLEGKVWPAIVRLCRAGWKMLRAVGRLLWDGILAGVALLKVGVEWLAVKLNRFYSLLPVTWQFLLTGFVLVFLMYIMMRTYKVGYILLGFGIFFGVLLYAASSFGILLEAAKRMSKGDLDEKVDDRLLAGCFREFAGELNSLADVAVVAAQKQLKSERMKTELITNVSHDIKTPLTSIINYVDLLQKPHTEQQQEAYLEVLDRQSQRLKKLIDDLMEMSKASTGNMAVEIGIVDAAEAVNQSLGEFADKLEQANLTPVFRQPEEPIVMLADGRLVWRVMSNLLGNAVKYALPGTRIYLDLMAVDGKVIISMKNISREELNVSADELLERFVRGDASRNTEGSGLGLNIARSLMELQKGQLQLLVDGDLFKVTLIFPGA